MPDFRTDTGELTDAAGRLGGVAAALRPDYAGVDPGAFGFASAETAVTDFVSAWTAGGTSLADAVRAIQQGLGRAATNYSRAEETAAAEMHLRP